MMPNHLIEENNLSIAWAKVLNLILVCHKHELAPFIVSINAVDNEIVETTEIRDKLNLFLKEDKSFSVETVASTIFPKSFWNLNLPRQQLYARYIKNFPRIKKAHQNYGGTYFQRLISFNSTYNSAEGINQIEELINGWHDGLRRRSFYQAAIFDPRKDQSRKTFQGFPCLRHVSFNIIKMNSGYGLEIIGIYATQTVFEKAYGNYLGLYHLGKFMAHEMGIKFLGEKCISARLILKNNNNISTTKLKTLASEISPLLDETNKNAQ
ncbi:MAG: hypothetical protein RDU14_02660 [Melioribacteraceae bacterium]|nr:hypothetical protein [Melioribacteraceae bacterium]